MIYHMVRGKPCQCKDIRGGVSSVNWSSFVLKGLHLSMPEAISIAAILTVGLAKSIKRAMPAVKCSQCGAVNGVDQFGKSVPCWKCKAEIFLQEAEENDTEEETTNTSEERQNRIPTEPLDIRWKDYYQILQVHPTASQEVIKAAYDRLARIYHPDVNHEASSTPKMVDINEAFEVLGKLENRRLYHPEWLQRRRGSQPFTADDQQTFRDEATDEDSIIGLMRFAAEKAAEGRNRSQVADELTRKGVPYDVAANIVQRVFAYRSDLKRRDGGKSIGCGLLMLIVGGIITGLTYSAASEGGGTYVVTTGLFLIGGITLLVGIYKWLTS